MFREFLSVQNAHKVERGLRLQTAIKANKVDFRSLLALPVTDHAHPYKMEYPWEKVATADPKTLSVYGKWYASKIMCFYESQQMHKFGVLQDDLVQCPWMVESCCPYPAGLMTRLYMLIAVLCVGRVLRDKYIYEPKQKWVHPVDNCCWFGPYVMMVADEWEEKWGFFAGQEVEY